MKMSATPNLKRHEIARAIPPASAPTCMMPTENAGCQANVQRFSELFAFLRTGVTWLRKA
jgi:hypothetical protein